ncbi:class I SAM-dependent methyltransferase [Poseidonocella sp. HB161398]|uniref:class I SAM-dependent methyltransferase n=1 Tax=Poseidonocella sp. HB161398 TaxID=2320855 RepID=UPI001109D407|nr:class I SAM-dependent methyltransferase [Poseidonocella sp. HB161398]
MSDANRAQDAFWNKGPGQRWAEFQPDLDLLHGDVTRLLLEAAAPLAGLRVLDLGCGAGASSLAAAEAAGPDGRVAGCDFSHVLLERAAARAAEAGAATLSFFHADAQEDDLGGPWDLAISRFGLMFFADPVAAFANIRRHLVPGGRLVFAAWAEAADNPWFDLPRRAAAARLGAAAPEPPGAPGPMAFADSARVCGLLGEAGFAAAAAERVPAVMSHPGGVAAVLGILPFIGPVGGRMREAGGSAADLQAILDEVARGFARWDGPGGLRLPAEILLYSARA